MSTSVEFSAAEPVLEVLECPPSHNVVLLVGELTDSAEERELAGGMPAVRWTLRIPRGPGRTGTDLIDCVALNPEMQRRALGWAPGIWVAVEGELRRRFFRSAGRTTTRVEVEALSVAEVSPPAEPAPSTGEPSAA